MKVTLTYFKLTGKYYSEEEYRTSNHDWHDALREVKELMQLKRLPGLCENHGDYMVLMHSTTDTGFVPALIMPHHVREVMQGINENSDKMAQIEAILGGSSI